ncbi:glucan biosynthesis protein [Novipirellula aureliae]|nr:glucan biosynthesis protein [Novipirellula aureliae]
MRFGFVLILSILLIDESGVYAQPAGIEESTAIAMTDIRSYGSLQQLAKRTSEQPYISAAPLDDVLANLDYEQYREIHFRHDQAVWKETDSPFWLETFHRGFVQRDRVSLFTIEDSKVEEIRFSPDNFRYGTETEHVLTKRLASLVDAGHAGVRVVGCFPKATDVQEMLTFLGSSYFRGRSSDTVYGSSARGLAVNIGLPCSEEFPAFTAFWIQKAKPMDKTLSIMALLDSPSLSGAYAFEFEPGTMGTTVDVRSSLYFREIPEKIGIAPITSMWMWGDGLEGPELDNRPSVHDADGLLIRDRQGDRIWRPFARQSYPSVTRIATSGVAGFGLIQRNRDFEHYQDSNAQYHRRPNVWIEPLNHWEKGSIELLELPGAHEGVDNIGAYWVPQQPPRLGEPYNLHYRVHFSSQEIGGDSNVAKATQLSVERSEQRNRDFKRIKLDVRFAGQILENIDPQSLIVDAHTVRGNLISKTVKKTTQGDRLVSLEIEPIEHAPVEVTVALMHAGKDVSERFVYLCPDETPKFMYPQIYTRKE